MKLVYAHFPINAKVDKDNKGVEINNFLGGAHARKIKMQPGVTVTLSEDVKDELVFNGVDNAAISLSCAQISQVCKIGKKDERKFLDGIYVTDKSVKFPKEWSSSIVRKATFCTELTLSARVDVLMRCKWGKS